MLSVMGRMLRMFEGRFGRLTLAELSPQEALQAGTDPVVVLALASDDILFLNPGETQLNTAAKSNAIVFFAAGEWLRASFPAVFDASELRPFPQAREQVAPRIRRLAEALAIEVQNDKFLSPERLEFMLQELIL